MTPPPAPRPAGGAHRHVREDQPPLLELEVTEGSAMQDVHGTAARLEALRA
ncbi:hypothetical protein [Deinococcus sonorensis]|uniref:Uncharacterized protein n=2 Tax=Deinococcus sonorensis TaxID=309891 RepID=A0AAU7U6Z6_9DEIO